MNRTTFSLSLSVLLMASLLLSGCGLTASPTTEPTARPAPTTGPADAVAPTQAAAGVTVVDALGRSVEFSELPQRIVLAGKSTLLLVNSLYLFPEAQERLVGLVVGKQKVGEFLKLVDPAFDQKAVLEVEAGPEQITPLDPDVVVLKSMMADKLGKALEGLGVPVVYVDLETPEQYLRDIGTLGTLLGNEARAEEIQEYYQSRLDQVAEAVSGLEEAERPRTLLLQYTNQGGEIAFNVPPTSWLQTIETELAGGIPVWKEAGQGGGWTVVNLEQIAAWDPDQIFVIAYGQNAAEVADQLAADPKWQALKAVQNDRVYGFAGDFYSWDQPDPRWGLGLTWLASKIHADRTSDIDILQEVSQFYRQMYGLDEAVIQEQIVPKLQGDLE